VIPTRIAALEDGGEALSGAHLHRPAPHLVRDIFRPCAPPCTDLERIYAAFGSGLPSAVLSAEGPIAL